MKPAQNAVKNHRQSETSSMMGVYKITPGCELLETLRWFYKQLKRPLLR